MDPLCKIAWNVLYMVQNLVPRALSMVLATWRLWGHFHLVEWLTQMVRRRYGRALEDDQRDVLKSS